MYLFIDESGDPGFVNSLTKYFVISAVIVEKENIEQISKKINEIKNYFNIPKTAEIKFSKSNDRLKEHFYNIIKDTNFTTKSIIVKKDSIFSDYLKTKNEKFYNLMLKMLIDNIKLAENTSIVIDGKSNIIMKAKLKKYINKNNIKKIEFNNSKSNNLLQLADMIASALGYYYNKQDKSNFDKWKNLIETKLDIFNFR
ncbi:MAG: DUF3800 domain-containing protein [Rickettsiales bacterium]|nr:MAG: DUF3800 domain-containing protein [Rickettsiales bacterium]